MGRIGRSVGKGDHDKESQSISNISKFAYWVHAGLHWKKSGFLSRLALENSIDDEIEYAHSELLLEVHSLHLLAEG